jgi:hypothetical protein
MLSPTGAKLQETFAGSGIIFTIEQPAPGKAYSTIHVGGFVGLAEQVDVGNSDPGDMGLVFSDQIVGRTLAAEDLALPTAPRQIVTSPHDRAAITGSLVLA